jgi:HEPN domain-containing protein
MPLVDWPTRAVRLAWCASCAHLAVEKAIKGALLAESIPFRKVHDLFQLRSLLLRRAAS